MSNSMQLSDLLENEYWFQFLLSYDFVALLAELALLAYLIPKIISWRERRRLFPVRRSILINSNVYVLSLGAKVATIVINTQNIIDVLQAEIEIKSDSKRHPKLKGPKKNALRKLSKIKKEVIQEANNFKKNIEDIRWDVDRLEAMISSFSHVIDSKMAGKYVDLIGNSHLLTTKLTNALQEWQLDALGPEDLADLSENLDSIEDTAKQVLDIIRDLTK